LPIGVVEEVELQLDSLGEMVELVL
jgi:hypothetical protein